MRYSIKFSLLALRLSAFTANAADDEHAGHPEVERSHISSEPDWRVIGNVGFAF